MSVPIKNIFHHYRLPAGYNLFFLLLYTPIGLVLMTIRLFICFQLFLASVIFSPNTAIGKIVLRVLYFVLGLVICEENKDKKCDKSRLIISNHISPFDHIAVSLVLPCVSIDLYNLPNPVASLLCYKDLGVSQGRDHLRANARSYIRETTSPSLLLHPEGTTTNGHAALMKYGSWAFDITRNIFVIGLTAKRLPMFPKTTVLGAYWIVDLLYFFFSPFTIYKIIYVGRLDRNEEESCDEFATRVQKATADSLYLQVSNFSVNDKMEYVKRLAHQEVASVISTNSALSAEVNAWAMQVYEVLPHVPLDIIKKDLVRTRSVDMTITNLLERYIPEQTPTPPPSQPSTSSARISPNPSTPSSSSSPSSASASSSKSYSLDTSAVQFGNTMNERMRSFHERKQVLIANARRRYIEKHNLNIPGVNC